MNTIHSSSLAFYPAGYIKPDASGFDKNSVNPVDQQLGAESNRQRQELPASSPKQIEAALADVGLALDGNNAQSTDKRTARALAAYNDTRSQPIQSRLAGMISGIDLYA